MGKWFLIIFYALVTFRVAWIENTDLYATQKIGFFFMYFFGGVALMYFSWLYLELWGVVSKKKNGVYMLRSLLIPLTPFGFWTSWKFCDGDPAVVIGVVAFCVLFLFGGESLSRAFRKFFFSRPGNERFYNGFSERWQVVPFDVVYLGVNLASLYFLA
ncbi:hypothetical protein ACLD02_06605 [Alloalcanivorax sp. C16-2]|uniref:hypothetical protein n=1 Tax=Alloalcanivorax sp. C16-2 TaxID=3390052 RepID=UPI003970F1DC